MNDAAAHHDQSTPPAASPPPPAVEVNDVHIVRGGAAILAGVSCRIEAGSYTAILGPNGCGKTTLMRTITGHMFITAGSVSVLGQTIGRTDIRALRRRIAVVNPTADSAHAHVSGAVVDADLTAHEAVLTGFFGTVGLYDVPTDEQRSRADELLAEVGLDERRGLRFALLSTGEQRRCLIARALVRRPQLLILDEPTAGLDVAGREQVLATVDGLLGGDGASATTVIMITHHVEELSRHASQVLLMRQGKFIAAGRPAEVITPESLTATFGCRVFVRRLHGRYWLEVLPEAWGELVRTAEQQSSRTAD